MTIAKGLQGSYRCGLERLGASDPLPEARPVPAIPFCHPYRNTILQCQSHMLTPHIADYLRCRLLCRGQATAWRAVDVLIPMADVMTHFFDPFFDPIYTVLNQLASTREYLQSSLPDRAWGLLQQAEANIYHPQTYHLHTPSISALDSRQTASDASALSVTSPSNFPSKGTSRYLFILVKFQRVKHYRNPTRDRDRLDKTTASPAESSYLERVAQIRSKPSHFTPKGTHTGGTPQLEGWRTRIGSSPGAPQR